MSAKQQVGRAKGSAAAVKLKLKPRGLETLRNARAQALERDISDREWAELLGVNQSNLSRIVKGTADPGVPFIAGCFNVFGLHSVDCLFEIVPDLTRNGSDA